MAANSLPGEPWRPNNATVGYAFLENQCAHCARDGTLRTGLPHDELDSESACVILAASFRGEASEWRVLPDGNVRCLAFVPAGEPLTRPPCPYTIDMFDPAPAGER